MANQELLDEMNRALNITERAYPRLMRSFQRNMARVDRIEQQVEDLQQELQTRGRQLGADRRRTMQNEIQRLNQSRQDGIRQVSFDSSRLMIIQRIYFDADLDERALALAGQVESITAGRLPFPGSDEDNQAQINRMGIGF